MWYRAYSKARVLVLGFVSCLCLFFWVAADVWLILAQTSEFKGGQDCHMERAMFCMWKAALTLGIWK